MSREYFPRDPNFRPPPWLIAETRANQSIQIPDENRISAYFDPDTKQQYSLAKALLEGQTDLSGLEKEVSRELELRSGRPADGFYLPVWAITRALARADLLGGTGPTPSSGTAGQTFVPLQIEPSLIEVLRPRLVTGRAGAVLLENLRGNLSLPRMNNANQAQWTPENGLISRSSPTFDSINMFPKRVGTVTAYSQQLLAQSTLDVSFIIADDIIKSIAVAIDQAAFTGTGPANNQPTGLFTLTANAPGAFAPGLRSPDQTFGGVAASYNSIVAFEGAVTDSNVELDGSAAYVTTPKTKARLKVIPKSVNYPDYIWNQLGPNNSEVGSGRAGFASKLIPGDRVVFGKFSDMLIGMWGGSLDIVQDPFTLADQFLIRIVIHSLADVAFRHAISFCVSTDAGNS